MVERQLPKLNVAGSIPVSRSIARLAADRIADLAMCGSLATDIDQGYPVMRTPARSEGKSRVFCRASQSDAIAGNTSGSANAWRRTGRGGRRAQ